MTSRILKFFTVPGVKRRVELDFLRGIAILMVMGTHFFLPASGIPILDSIFAWFKRCGGAGVDLFFVLSGFLVGGLLLKEYRETGVIQARRFLIRRGLKIWPAFYFLLLVHTIVRSHPIETFLWQNAFHVQNYFGTTIRQTWSLAIEEHFYLALTILLAWAAAKRFGPRRLLAIMAGICLIAGGIRVATVMAGNLDGAFRWTQNRLDSLMFGVIIATLFHLKRDIYDGIARQKLALIVISAAGFAFLWFANGDPALMRTSGYTLIYLSFGAFLILVYEHSGKMGEWLLYRGIAWVGIYSYGIYLWHTITLAPARKLAAHIPTDLQWIVLILFQFTLSVAVGVVLTHLVEWPFLRWRERHMGKQENPAHTATGPLIAKTG